MAIEVYEAALGCIKEGIPAVVATVVDVKGSSPREKGAKMLVREDGSIVGTVGGGSLEASVIKTAVDMLRKGRDTRILSFRLEDLDMTCGGAATVLFEPLAYKRRMIVFGAGHVGQELAYFGSRLGFRVVVVDDRSEWANEDRFPSQVELLVAPFLDAIERLSPGPGDVIVIVTRGHSFDQEVLEACVSRGASYLGMIGSKSKVTRAFDLLRENGVGEEEIAAVRAPVGLDIGGKTPAEIAISVMAEVIAVLNGKDSVVPMRDSSTAGSHSRSKGV